MTFWFYIYYEMYSSDHCIHKCTKTTMTLRLWQHEYYFKRCYGNTLINSTFSEILKEDKSTSFGKKLHQILMKNYILRIVNLEKWIFCWMSCRKLLFGQLAYPPSQLTLFQQHSPLPLPQIGSGSVCFSLHLKFSIFFFIWKVPLLSSSHTKLLRTCIIHFNMKKGTK